MAATLWAEVVARLHQREAELVVDHGEPARRQGQLAPSLARDRLTLGLGLGNEAGLVGELSARGLQLAVA